MQIRLATLAIIVGLGYVVANQPTSFDTYIHESKKFTLDLYEGKFLSDMSQKDKDNIDVPKFDTLEDILGFTDEAATGEQENEFGSEQAGDDLINQILKDEAEEEEQLEKERQEEYRESKRKAKAEKKNKQKPDEGSGDSGSGESDNDKKEEM